MNVKYICVFILIFIHCLHNVVCFAHVDTGRKFIAAPSIPIVNDIKKSPVSDLQEYFCTSIFQGFPHLFFYSQVYLESLTFTIVSLEKNYWYLYLYDFPDMSNDATQKETKTYFIQDSPAAFIFFTLQLK